MFLGVGVLYFTTTYEISVGGKCPHILLQLGVEWLVLNRVRY